MKPLRILAFSLSACLILAATFFAYAHDTRAAQAPARAPTRFQLNEQTTGLAAAAGGTGLGNACPSGAQDCIARIAGNVINVLLSLSGLVLLGYFLYGGFLWMTAGGDTERVKKAKQTITNAVAGIVIIGLSFVLTTFVLSRLVSALGGTEASPGGTETSPGMRSIPVE